MQQPRSVTRSSSVPTLRKSTSIIISPGIYIVLCILPLIFPMNWVVSWAAAAVLHEFSHYIALSACAVRVHSVQIGFHGAKIITEPMQPWKEILCAGAGPLGGTVLFLSARWLPQLAVCAFFQTVLNLLPIREFDGGRILNCIFRMLFGGRTADRISALLESVILIVIVCIGLYISVHSKMGGLLPAIAILLLIRQAMQKLLAKPGNK